MSTTYSEKRLSVLCVSAHPDDEIGGAGGTLAKFAQSGARLTLVLCTSGESAGLSLTKEAARTRLAEFRSVARLLKAEAVFLNLPRYFSLTLGTLLPLVKALRGARPQLVLAPSRIESNPEHVAAGRLTEEACRIARRRKFSRCGLPWQVGEFWEYELDSAFPDFNRLEDISRFVTRKRELFTQYQSQLKSKDYLRAVLGLNQYRAITKRVGRYAEAFRTTQVL